MEPSVEGEGEPWRKAVCRNDRYGYRLRKDGPDYGFGEIFTNPPDIGGRYSVLSLFGLVPAALLGLDIARLLERATGMAGLCRQQKDIEGAS
ncbi:MAG TPA: hypothetical protein VN647_07215 [Nitrospira sp.]|nr:hypothetical protein [Nitrospira sp.]